MLVEEVFSYPGLGQAAVTAGLGGDVALLAGIALVSAALVFAGNLAANLIYGLVDPRMRPVRKLARATAAVGVPSAGATFGPSASPEASAVETTSPIPPASDERTPR